MLDRRRASKSVMRAQPKRVIRSPRFAPAGAAVSRAVSSTKTGRPVFVLETALETAAPAGAKRGDRMTRFGCALMTDLDALLRSSIQRRAFSTTVSQFPPCFRKLKGTLMVEPAAPG